MTTVRSGTRTIVLRRLNWAVAFLIGAGSLGHALAIVAHGFCFNVGVEIVESIEIQDRIPFAFNLDHRGHIDAARWANEEIGRL